MMETLTFSTCWNKRAGIAGNGKFDCACFSTIRLYNSNKHVVGNKVKVALKSKELGVAEVVAVKPFRVDELTDAEAYLDTGYNADEVKDIMRKMWKDKFSNNSVFALVVLRWCDQTNLFEQQ